MNTELFLKGLIIGGAAGVAAGILFAPESGKETRDRIYNSSQDLLNRARTQYEGARQKVTELSEDTKVSYHEEKDRLKKAVQAGINTYKDTKAEISHA
ncbi:MAG: YtxH domain-containing protein [Smithellaceae bacterium]